jgi:hypothetical protein
LSADLLGGLYLLRDVKPRGPLSRHAGSLAMRLRRVPERAVQAELDAYAELVAVAVRIAREHRDPRGQTAPAGGLLHIVATKHLKLGENVGEDPDRHRQERAGADPAYAAFMAAADRWADAGRDVVRQSRYCGGEGWISEYEGRQRALALARQPAADLVGPPRGGARRRRRLPVRDEHLAFAAALLTQP